ncbi:MAG: hypothetical protein MUE74_02850 [Bacteroidales bacterium]|jgi:hypothetical protein|nr:hypothetical protein [Bacteroidales bacterium]
MNCIVFSRTAAASLVFLLTVPLFSQSLEEGFLDPPVSAKPRTWWHWTNSNISTEGITKDLEWMKNAGIGGFQIADVASGQGQIVEKKIPFGSPEWYNAVRHAAAEADRLGLEMTVFSSPGWSLTGGPWVKPEQAMKKLVWSEMNLKGPLKFKGKLPPVPSNEGPVRNLSRSAKPGPNESKFSRDFLVLAFPTPRDETDIRSLNPVITTSGGPVDTEALLDDDLNTAARIRSGKDRTTTWIQFLFDKPVSVKAVTLANRSGIPVGTIKAGNDPSQLKTLAILPGPQLYRAGKVTTYSFTETAATCFRVEFTGAPLRPADVMAETVTKPDSVYVFSELKLHTGARINRWEDKAGFYHLFAYEPVESVSVPQPSAVDEARIINLTSMLKPDGSFEWDVPAGDWTIMRFGYSLTGSTNRPAVPSGSGFEVDKLSSRHSEDYIRAYTDPIRQSLGQLYGRSMQYVLLDSWEAGMQNWTDEMTGEFARRRGYDPTPYLPCLAGRVVGNSEFSDRFLWDFRRTLADMFAENHFKVITDYLHNQGIKTYGEVSGVSLEILEDALLCKKYVDIPMGEFWRGKMHPDLMYYQDVRGAASASHIYGKNIVATESFTGGGFDSPRSLKETGDYWFSQGVNRIIFHTSAHQPLDTKPGNTMVGTHINRNITWAEQAGPFMKYLARNSFMLQQGTFVADIAYLLNEGAPSTMPIWGEGLSPALPEGYDFDYINADVLLNLMTVNTDGKLSLPSGMAYELLVLPPTDKMTLPVLRKLHSLVIAGARISGQRPLTTPGLTGYPGSQKEFDELVSGLWGDLDGISRTIRTFGKGKVYWGVSPGRILEMNGVNPDVILNASRGEISWIHRRTKDEDIYFIVNLTDTTANLSMKFRTTGREAEIWDPSAGTVRPASYFISQSNTAVPLFLGKRQSVFVVFRKETNIKTRTIPQAEPVLITTLTGPWDISFPPDLGAPAGISVEKLESWTSNADEGIKYFSGTATYTKTFEVPKRWMAGGQKLILDLGKVGDLAEVKVNGQPAGILWDHPFRTDITSLVRKGSNTLEIMVTNEWTNRLAGDQKAAPGKKVLNSSMFVFSRGLSESGLMGPVRILRE